VVWKPDQTFKKSERGRSLAREIALLLCPGFLSLSDYSSSNEPSIFRCHLFQRHYLAAWHQVACVAVPRISSIERRMSCPEYLRLRHRYEACLKRWAQVAWPPHSYEPFPISARHAAEIRAIASTERKAAHERMYVHLKNCPVCKPLGSTHRPRGLS
jgi:hypothetical protein